MSLTDQTLQFFPVSARVSVLRARGLRIKGKDGTNDAYTTLQAGRETFRTPVSEKLAEPVWGGSDAAFIFTLPAESQQDGVPLQVRVFHRVPLGADKLLGLAVINVHELRQNSARENPQWFKLLNKTGKADKERGEVLLDIQFLKSSMSVSMIDLSEKSHSRLGKFKDKLRGKKKDGLSDSASAILPSAGQVLTDSEGELEGEREDETTKKKKNKLKSLFVPKSNMKRNSLSQSLSSLKSLPDKNSSISSSTSSGLNVESSEGKKKKKFSFLTHKRNGSTDSRTSNHSDFTLSSTNPIPPPQIDICINGSYVYGEETQSEKMQDMDEEEEEEAENEEEEETWRREEELRERLEEEKRREAEEERRRKEREEHRRRMEEEDKERVRMEKDIEVQRRRMEEEEKERIKVEKEKEEQKRKIDEEEKERVRMARQKEEQRRTMAEEKVRMEREKEEERMRMAEEEKERNRMEREIKERRRLIEEEEEKERIRIERETEEERRVEEEEKERRRREKEEQRMKLQEEGMRVKREKEEQIRFEQERKRREEKESEELRIKMAAENDRKKAEEEEKMRIAEEERKKRAERERFMATEEKRLEMERLAGEKKAREEEEARIASEKENRRREEEQVREERERKRAEMEIKRNKEEQEQRNIEMEEQKKKEKQMRQEQEKLNKEENMFEESVFSQSTDLTRSARISNVKPRVSVSATVSQPSMENTNPFLDDKLYAISFEERTVKGLAPSPPQFVGPEVCAIGVSKELSHSKEVSKRQAPQPPGMPKMSREVTDKENMSQVGLDQGARKERHQESTVLSVSQDDTQVNTNPFTCDEPVPVKHNKRPAPKPGVSEDKPRSNGKILPEGTVPHEEKASVSNSKENPSNWKLLNEPNDITVEDVKSDLTDDQSRTEEQLEDSTHLHAPSGVNRDVFSEPPVSRTDGLLSMESLQKKSRAPLPPNKPKRSGDPSMLHQQLSLLSKTNFKQTQANHINQKDQDNASVSSPTFSPLADKSQVVKCYDSKMGETSSKSGSGTLPWAKVVSSDAGEVREQGAPIPVIRQHAVKPLSAAEKQPETYESWVTDSTQPKTKAVEAVIKGPYSQLTQAELISLALRQQEQILQRDARIQEMERYIDNLLVRVIEEKPSILMSLNKSI